VESQKFPEAPTKGHSLLVINDTFFVLGNAFDRTLFTFRFAARGKGNFPFLQLRLAKIVVGSAWRQHAIGGKGAPKTIEGHRAVCLILNKTQRVICVTAASSTLFCLATGFQELKERLSGLNLNLVESRSAFVRNLKGRSARGSYIQEAHPMSARSSSPSNLEEGDPFSSALSELPPEELRARVDIIQNRYRKELESGRFKMKSDDYLTLVAAASVERKRCHLMKKELGEATKAEESSHIEMLKAEAKARKVATHNNTLKQALEQALEEVQALQTFIAEGDSQAKEEIEDRVKSVNDILKGALATAPNDLVKVSWNAPTPTSYISLKGIKKKPAENEVTKRDSGGNLPFLTEVAARNEAVSLQKRLGLDVSVSDNLADFHPLSNFHERLSSAISSFQSSWKR
jgi:metal-responsive CopG/Arc/MetJ family transcriptional regulator